MISFLGLCVQNLIKSIKYMLSGRVRFTSVVSQAAAISYDSLPISLIIAFIASAVIAIQVSKEFLISGAESYVGGTMTLIIIREVAPSFVALAISARAGTAISAEIANMKVTSQVDAIKTLKVEPVGYYFAPRLLSAAVTVPMVVLVAELLAIIGGMFICFFTINLHPNRYITSVWLWLKTRDIYVSIFKAFCFGVTVALVCATQGYSTDGGAKEVGTATTQAAIKSTIYMIIVDFIIDIIFYV
ncbi:ABC transporter permease [bacterium]|nr:ABC transporter permease [bacterium]